MLGERCAGRINGTSCRSAAARLTDDASASFLKDAMTASRNDAATPLLSPEAWQAPTASVLRQKGRVRAFKHSDARDVAKMFGGVFRASAACDQESLARDLASIFIEHPLYRPDAGSLIHESSDGRISGFLGCLPTPFLLDGGQLSGSVLSTWMVGDRLEDPRAGALLLKAHLQRPLDLTIVDTANARSLQFSKASKIGVLPTYSLQWFKPLNFAGYAASVVTKGLRLGADGPIVSAARRSEDMARRFIGSDPEESPTNWTSRVIDETVFAERLLSFLEPLKLRPMWTEEVIAWMLAHAGRRPTKGPLSFFEVLDEKKRSAGCFAYHATSNGRAFVLQALARPQAEEAMLRVMISTARRNKCVSISGASNPRLLDGLFRIPGILYRHACATAVKASKRDYVDLLGAGEGLVGGMIGDNWTPLASESY